MGGWQWAMGKRRKTLTPALSQGEREEEKEEEGGREEERGEEDEEMKNPLPCGAAGGWGELETVGCFVAVVLLCGRCGFSCDDDGWRRGHRWRGVPWHLVLGRQRVGLGSRRLRGLRHCWSFRRRWRGRSSCRR